MNLTEIFDTPPTDPQTELEMLGAKAKIAERRADRALEKYIEIIEPLYDNGEAKRMNTHSDELVNVPNSGTWIRKDSKHIDIVMVAGAKHDKLLAVEKRIMARVNELKKQLGWFDEDDT